MRVVTVRTEDKVTLPCWPQLPNCSRINWVLAGKSVINISFLGSQQYGEGFGNLSVTSDCSLEIMNTTETLAGLLICSWSEPYQDFANFYLSVVSGEYLNLPRSGRMCVCVSPCCDWLTALKD